MTSITVKNQPADYGTNGWSAIAATRVPFERLTEAIAADFIVIGAGFAGLAAARRLCLNQPEAKVVLLEANQIGQGPAGRNSGFMIDLPHDLQSQNYGGAGLEQTKSEIRDNRLAIDFASHLAEQAAMPASVFDKSGKINGAATQKGADHNRTYAAQLDDLGEAHRLLDAQQMKALTGTDFYIHGLFTPGAAIIQPAQFVGQMASHIARHRCLRIYEGSGVTALSRHQGTWKAQTAEGSVSAPQVILAVNGHLNSFGYAKRQIMHIFTYGSLSRPLTPNEVSTLGGTSQWALTPADPMGTTVRRIFHDGDHRILVRNRFTYDPSMTIDQERIKAVGQDHKRSFSARFPMLPRVEMAHCWGGRLAVTRNSVSVFGEVDTGLYAACVQNGLGVAKGIFQGMMAADLACGVGSDALDRLVGQSKPQRLLPPPFMALGASSFLRLKEWQAGAEL